MFVFATHWFFCSSLSLRTLPKVLIQSPFKPAFKLFFLLFSKACANSGEGIIHKATWTNLGVTLPQAVGQPPSYLWIPKNFLSMQLESEIPRQVIASFSCCFLLLPLSFYVVLKSFSNHLVPPLIQCFLCFSKFLHACLCHTVLQVEFILCAFFPSFFYFAFKNPVLH